MIIAKKKSVITVSWYATVQCDYRCIFVNSEASKRVMEYLAQVSGKGQEVDKIKEQLLQSNPVLEGTISQQKF